MSTKVNNERSNAMAMASVGMMILLLWIGVSSTLIKINWMDGQFNASIFLSLVFPSVMVTHFLGKAGVYKMIYLFFGYLGMLLLLLTAVHHPSMPSQLVGIFWAVFMLPSVLLPSLMLIKHTEFSKMEKLTAGWFWTGVFPGLFLLKKYMALNLFKLNTPGISPRVVFSKKILLQIWN